MLNCWCWMMPFLFAVVLGAAPAGCSWQFLATAAAAAAAGCCWLLLAAAGCCCCCCCWMLLLLLLLAALGDPGCVWLITAALCSCFKQGWCDSMIALRFCYTTSKPQHERASNSENLLGNFQTTTWAESIIANIPSSIFIDFHWVSLHVHGSGELGAWIPCVCIANMCWEHEKPLFV